MIVFKIVFLLNLEIVLNHLYHQPAHGEQHQYLLLVDQKNPMMLHLIHGISQKYGLKVFQKKNQ